MSFATRCGRALFAGAAWFGAALAHAGFYGNTVSANYVWPNVDAVLYAGGNAVAGTGVEFPRLGASNIVVDFSDTGFRITYPTGWTFGTTVSRTFDGFVIADSGGTIADIVGIDDVTSNIPGFARNAVTFDANHVYVNQLAFGKISAGGFIDVKVQFKGSSPPPGAAASTGVAVEFFNATMGHYFVTAFPEEAAALDAGKIAGWARTGLTFPVDTAAVGAAQPVCRFFSATFAPRSSHFYTPYPDECAKLKTGTVWGYEAIAFYLALPDAAGRCAANATPIYRFYNNGVTNAPNHRYTSDPLVVRLMKAQGWTAEGNTATGVFACGPAAPASKSALEVKMEFNPALRFLSTADGAAIVARTATTISFDRAVDLAAGDVFVIPEAGAWRAVAVQRTGNQTIVTVEEPTLEELFTELDISGTASVADTPEVGANAAATARSGLQTEVEPTFVKTTNAAGDEGRKFNVQLQAQCGSNPQSKMRLLEFTGELYGLQNIKFNMKTPSSSTIGPLTYRVSAGAYIGCKLALPLGSPLKILDVPILGTAGFVRIQLIVQARLETDIAPVLQVIEVQADGNIPVTAGAPSLKAANPGLANALLQGAGIGTTFSATLIGELDASAKLIVPIVSTLLGSAGVKTGPALDVKAAAVAKATGADVDICAELKWPSQIYVQYRTGRGVTTKPVFQTDYTVQLPDNWKQCAGGNAPSGDWRFTTRVCTPDPTNPPVCNYRCNDTIDFTMSANADKSKIDVFYPMGSASRYMSMVPQGPVRGYLGSASNNGTVEVQTVQFAADWKAATWLYTVMYPLGDAVCAAQQSGDAALTNPR